MCIRSSLSTCRASTPGPHAKQTILALRSNPAQPRLHTANMQGSQLQAAPNVVQHTGGHQTGTFGTVGWNGGALYIIHCMCSKAELANQILCDSLVRWEYLGRPQLHSVLVHIRSEPSTYKHYSHSNSLPAEAEERQCFICVVPQLPSVPASTIAALLPSLTRAGVLEGTSQTRHCLFDRQYISSEMPFEGGVLCRCCGSDLTSRTEVFMAILVAFLVFGGRDDRTMCNITSCCQRLLGC